MLCNLVVENYALISKLEIDFKKGLTIITGETGAGKSILLGALSLILGKRADTTALYDKTKKCIVEGTFDITQYNLQEFFNERDLEYDNQTILRREVAATGKSRAFINDLPVNLELLSDLGLRLIDIHSQHQNLNLADNLFQLKVIDSYAQNHTLLSKYNQQYQQYHEILRQYQQLSDEAARTKADLDYFMFQHSQLEEARLVEGEQEEFEYELEKLTHAEEIKTALFSVTAGLQGEGESALQRLKDSTAVLTRVARFLHGHENLASRMDSVYIELKDIAREVELLNNQLTHDPERLTYLNDRLALIYNLEQKHQVGTLKELINLRDQLKEKIAAINAYDFNLETLTKRLANEENTLQEIASALTAARKKVTGAFEQRIVDMLREVGIPNAGFAIQLGTLDKYTPHGKDNIQFLFTANKNMPTQNIARIASGGELSRLMLCVKSLMSDASGLPTIVFDEIDTGVSGEIAERVGNIITRMAGKMQIINITHLPQVASKGEYHYLVYKTDEENATVTRMKLLTLKERHLEIAKMLSGEEITQAALENARALLGN